MTTWSHLPNRPAKVILAMALQRCVVCWRPFEATCDGPPWRDTLSLGEPWCNTPLCLQHAKSVPNESHLCPRCAEASQ